MSGYSSGKKPHLAEKRKRERFRKEHPEGRKMFAKNKKFIISL